MNVLDFGRVISMLSIDTPISLAFDEKYGQKKDVWWSCQREHLTVWCLYQPTFGILPYEHSLNYSARMMYNRFGRPETLLWLAEALGEKNEILLKVVEEIKDIIIHKPRTACGILREEISFDRILELIDLGLKTGNFKIPATNHIPIITEQ